MDEDCCLTIKVGDFGIANRNESGSFHTYVGTIQYMAPERFAGSHTLAVDSWAVGCLLYRLLTKKDLFIHSLATCQYEYTGEPRLEEELKFCQDSETICFIKSLIQAEPQHRATPEAALGHPWLRELRDDPERFGKRLATQTLKEHFDKVKSEGLRPRVII